MAEQSRDQKESDDDTLRDSEVALMDTLKAVFEIIVAKRILSPKVIDEMLVRQSAQYDPAAMPRAIFVVDELRRCVTDPARAQARQFLDRPPEGQA
jgi:hypothetical protein